MTTNHDDTQAILTKIESLLEESNVSFSGMITIETENSLAVSLSTINSKVNTPISCFMVH